MVFPKAFFKVLKKFIFFLKKPVTGGTETVMLKVRLSASLKNLNKPKGGSNMENVSISIITISTAKNK